MKIIRLWGIAAIMALLSGSLLAASSAQVHDDGYLYVNEEPFFAIGMYCVPEPDMAILAQSGFNLVQTYGWEHKWVWDEGREWLDAVQACGMKAIVGLPRSAVREMATDALIGRLERYRKHPAVIAWQVMDEPEGEEAEQYMMHAYKLVKEHGGGWPAATVVHRWKNVAPFMPYVDIMQADHYPVPPIPIGWFAGTGVRGVKVYADLAREASGGRKPFWYVAQAFDCSIGKAKGFEVPAEWHRPPNRTEIRAMTYTAIASGARGILYWCLPWMMQDEESRQGDPAAIRAYLGGAELWIHIKEVVSELNQLMPVLTSTGPEVITDRDHVVSLVKARGQDIYIIAANYEREPVSTIIRVPGLERTTAQRMFQEGTTQIRDGGLHLDFEALGTQVYRISAGASRALYPDE